MDDNRPLVIIAGFGDLFGVALARKYSDQGYRVVGISRSKSEQALLALQDFNFVHSVADLTNFEDAENTFNALFRDFGCPAVVVHNIAKLVISPVNQIQQQEFTATWEAVCMTAFVCAQACLPVMALQRGGCFIITGATASIRGSAKFAAFASAKFALRGLAQSLAREYGPQGVHIIHTIIDGLIWGEKTQTRFDPSPDVCLMPEDLAEQYFLLSSQPRSTWTHEVDLRPSTEQF